MTVYLRICHDHNLVIFVAQQYIIWPTFEDYHYFRRSTFNIHALGISHFKALRTTISSTILSELNTHSTCLP